MEKRMRGIGLALLVLTSLVFVRSSFAERNKEVAVVKYEKYEYGAKRQAYTKKLVEAIKNVSSYEADLVSVDIFLEANKDECATYKRIAIPCMATKFSPEMYQGMTDYMKNGGLLITNAELGSIGDYKGDKGGSRYKSGNPLVGVYGHSSSELTKIKVESITPLTEGIPVGEWIPLEKKAAGRQTFNRSATVLITSDSIHKGNPSIKQPFLAYKNLGEGACIYIVPMVWSADAKYVYTILKNALSEKTLNWLTAGDVL